MCEFEPRWEYNIIRMDLDIIKPDGTINLIAIEIDDYIGEDYWDNSWEDKFIYDAF